MVAWKQPPGWSMQTRQQFHPSGLLMGFFGGQFILSLLIENPCRHPKTIFGPVGTHSHVCWHIINNKKMPLTKHNCCKGHVCVTEGVSNLIKMKIKLNLIDVLLYMLSLLAFLSLVRGSFLKCCTQKYLKPPKLNYNNLKKQHHNFMFQTSTFGIVLN